MAVVRSSILLQGLQTFTPRLRHPRHARPDEAALADHVVKKPGVRQLVYPGCEDHPTPDRLSAG